MKPCLAAAIEFLKLGWSVIPLCTHDHAGVPGVHEKECDAPGQRPLWPWQQYQEKPIGEKALRVIWNRCPDANVGIILGPVSKLLGIEFGPAGVQRFCDVSKSRSTPPTLQFATPDGGLCLLFQWLDEQEAIIPSAASASPAAVRILGRGSHLPAPPSLHWTGKPYVWSKFRDPEHIKAQPCPAWLLDELIALQKAPPAPLRIVPAPDTAEPPSRLAIFDGKPTPIDACAYRFSTIAPKHVDWLWPGWIALGKLTILDGDPGLGKSTMLLDLAARVSSTGVMPDHKQGVVGNVIVMSAEDSPEDTIKPRLQAAGADEDRIINLSHIVGKDGERPIEVPADFPAIARKIEEHDARLLIIDPLLAFLCGADANNDQEVRRVLYKLSKIAEKRRCAVVCMRHLNKTGGRKAIYRGNSSIAVIGHARTGLLIAPDPDDEAARVLAVSKCNLGPRPQSLRFLLEPHGDVCRVDWLGTSPYDADQLLTTVRREEERRNEETARSKVVQAASILEMLLEKYQRRLEVKIAKGDLASAGLSGSTVDRAVRKLQLKLTYEIGAQGERTYYWSPKSA